MQKTEEFGVTYQIANGIRHKRLDRKDEPKCYSSISCAHPALYVASPEPSKYTAESTSRAPSASIMGINIGATALLSRSTRSSTASPSTSSELETVPSSLDAPFASVLRSSA